MKFDIFKIKTIVITDERSGFEKTGRRTIDDYCEKNCNSRLSKRPLTTILQYLFSIKAVRIFLPVYLNTEWAVFSLQAKPQTCI
jgi:hypothetical protein